MKYELSKSVNEVLSDLDYRNASGRLKNDKHLEALYLRVRSLIILGRFGEASAEMRSLEFPYGVQRFLEIQLISYEKGISSESLQALSDVKAFLPQNAYIMAEFYFIRGYFFFTLGENLKSLREQDKAAELYRRLNLHSCLAHSLFNSCVAAQAIQSKPLYERTRRQLVALIHAKSGTENSVPGVVMNIPQYLNERLKGYEATSLEDFEKAEDSLKMCLVFAEKNGRWRDTGAILAHLAYLYSSLGQVDQWTDLVLEFKESLERVPSMYCKAISAFEYLDSKAMLNCTEVKSLLNEWMQAKWDPILTLFLCERLLNKLIQSREYELANSVVQTISEFAREHQRVLGEVDYRPQAITALMRQGHRERAREILCAYQNDARVDQNEVRLDRADRLWLDYRESVLTSGDQGQLEAGNNDSLGDSFEESFEALVEIDVFKMELRLRNQRVDLSQRPTVFSFFLAISARRGSKDIGALFKRVYGVQYHPALHERRWNSLIERSRKIVGPKRILRSGGSIRWAPQVHVHIKQRYEFLVSRSGRFAKIIRMIQSSDRPLGTGALHERVQFSRRTLQSDLRELVQLGAIESNGKGRGVTYSVPKS